MKTTKIKKDTEYIFKKSGNIVKTIEKVKMSKNFGYIQFWEVERVDNKKKLIVSENYLKELNNVK